MSLDSIGIAGFGHDFEALQGHESDIQILFDSFTRSPGKSSSAIAESASRKLLGSLLPSQFLDLFPSKRLRLMKRFRETMSGVSAELWRKSKAEKGDSKVRSVMGSLGKFILASREFYCHSLIGGFCFRDVVRAEESTTGWKLTADEVLGEVKFLGISCNTRSSFLHFVIKMNDLLLAGYETTSGEFIRLSSP